MKLKLLYTMIATLVANTACKTTTNSSGVKGGPSSTEKLETLNFDQVFKTKNGMFLGQFDRAITFDSATKAADLGRVDDKCFYGNQTKITLVTCDNNFNAPQEMISFGIVDPRPNGTVSVVYPIPGSKSLPRAELSDGTKIPLTPASEKDKSTLLSALRNRTIPIKVEIPRVAKYLYQGQKSGQFFLLEEMRVTSFDKAGAFLKSNEVEMISADVTFFSFDGQSFTLPTFDQPAAPGTIRKDKQVVDNIKEVVAKEEILAYLKQHGFKLDLTPFIPPSGTSLAEQLKNGPK